MSQNPLHTSATTHLVNILSRRIWDPRLRRGCADNIADVINGEFGIELSKLPQDHAAATEDLRDRGITFPKVPFSPEEVAGIRAYFQRRKSQLTPAEPTRFKYSPSEIIGAPHLLEFALSEQILSPLAHYFGTMPLLSSVQAWWQEHGAPLEGDQIVHRDQIDVVYCKLFIYLTDVGLEDAPHSFYVGTHAYSHVKKKMLKAGVPATQLPTALRYFFEANFGQIGVDVIEMFKDDCLTILGKAGTAFLADTSALHVGGIPDPGHTRLIFAAVYSINLDPVFFDEMTRLRSLPSWRQRVPGSDLAQFAVRPWM